MSRSLRILLTHVYCWPEHRRGSERYLHELAAALTHSGHRVNVLSTGQVAGRTQVRGVPVRMLRRRQLLPRKYGTVADQVAFGWQSLVPALRGRYDVWHAMSIPDGLAATAWSHRPTARIRASHVRPVSVFTDHGFPARPSREKRPDHRSFTRLVRTVDTYVCVSEPAAGYLRRDYGRDPVVISPGVDTDAFTPGSDRDRHQQPVVLYVGALNESRKNVALLLEAVALLVLDVPNLEVWLIGQGDPTALLAAAPTVARACVTRCGPAEPAALPAIYRAAWVTALPAEAEVFGMAVAESLACGTPAVVLDNDLGPATIVTRGTGVRSGPTPAALAGALAEGLDVTRRSETREACRLRAADYDWRRRVVPALEAVYRRESSM